MQFRNNEEPIISFILPSYKYPLAFFIYYCHINDAFDYSKTNRSHASGNIQNLYKHPYLPENSFFQSYFLFPICLWSWDSP